MENLRNKPSQYIVLQEESKNIKFDSFAAQLQTVDPFTHKLELTSLDVIKVVINAFWLFPLRVCLALPSFLAICIFGIVVILEKTKNKGHLLDGGGKFVLHVAERHDVNDYVDNGVPKFLVHRIGTILTRVFLFGLGFHRIRIIGHPVPPRLAPITVAIPHSSLFDMFLLSLIEPPSFVTRANNRNVPILGRLYEHGLKCIFVSRLDSDSRRRCNEEIMRRASSDEEWPPLLIFPEGTTTNRKAIIQFKHGAFSPKVPIQPVLIKHYNRLNTLIWTENGLGVLTGLFLTICQFNNSVELEYLPLYTPSEQEKESPTIYAENVRDMMSIAIGIPKSNHTFEDVVLIRECKRLGLPHETGLVEFGQTARPYSITYIQVEYLLKRFANIDTNKDGMISVEDLAVFLKVPHDNCLQSVFNSFDTDDDGLVGFRKYAFGILHQSKQLLQNDQSIQQLFEFFDSNSDGQVTREDLLKLPLQIEQKYIQNIHEDQIVYAKCGFFCKCGKLISRRHITDEELGEQDNYNWNIYELLGPWNFDQFKQLLTDYLLLFYEYQNAGLSNSQ